MGDAQSSQRARGPKPRVPPRPSRPSPSQHITLPRTASYSVPDHIPQPVNQTMFQGFEWYIPPDHSHWARLTSQLPLLASLGVTSMWIPPGCKAASQKGNGYDHYDLWDLGEFGQKGGRATKWGPKEDLVALGHEARRCGVGLLWDTVMNHKAAADGTERVLARRIDEDDRTKPLDAKPREIEAWTHFTFPGRGTTYSAMQWGAEHFNGVDWDQIRGEKAIWKFESKTWAKDVSDERGNFDYLMFANVDHRHRGVRAEFLRWAEWLPTQVPGMAGMRLDAIKHYSRGFLVDFVDQLDRSVGRDWFHVGEYWDVDSSVLSRCIDAFPRRRMALFDVRLCDNLSKISMNPDKSDLRTVFDDSLSLWRPANSVSFVVNHDTQDGQSLHTPVADFFLPHAYALILLRLNAGLPCVFWGDLYGSCAVDLHTPEIDTSKFRPPPAGGGLVPRLMLVRRLWAYGSQHDYFDEPTCVGFTREGHASQGEDGCATVLTQGWEWRAKRMFVGRRHAGEVWSDVLRQCPGTVMVDAEGWGLFPVAARSVSVWVRTDAAGRGQVDGFVGDWDVFGLKARRKGVLLGGEEVRG